MTNDLPDIQKTEPYIKTPINQVGVERVAVPFKLESKTGAFNQMVAEVSMRTNLEANVKGISMSRLLRTLKVYLDLPLKQKLIQQILQEIAVAVGSSESYMKFDFLMPIIRPSALTDNEFPIYHKCRFEGQLTTKPGVTKKDLGDGKFGVSVGDKWDFKFYQGVVVQYASYCPCSAELSKDLMSKGSIGFPHAQRSFAHILVECGSDNYIWLEDLVEATEKAIKTIPYPIIKREDEQHIAKIAAENPIFVEDAIRSISSQIDSIPGVHDWIIKCIHEESIHTSEAIAVNYKGIKDGFDHRYYL